MVESTNFVDDTWFGEEGFIHSDKMRVIERLWLTPDNNPGVSGDSGRPRDAYQAVD